MLRGIQNICGGPRGFQAYLRSHQYFYSKTMAAHNTAANVQNLPHLPVPKLEDTLRKYLRSVKPLLNDEEFSSTTKLVQNFAENEGRKLQAVLESKAEKSLNWLEDWWLNVAYLEYRDPVVVFSSPGLVFPIRVFESQQDQLKYAAKTIVAAIGYKTLIYNNEIPTEMMGKAQLDMAQYKKIFGTCRLPGDKRDCLSYNPDSKHITVMHNNHIFNLELWGADNVLLNEEQIVEQLQKVIKMSSTRTDDAIGVLTSDNRDNWAKAYKILNNDAKNKEYLTDIEKSLFILCLDTKVGLPDIKDSNAQRNLAGQQTIHGGGAGCNGSNRWFDKTVQFIVGADGVMGLTYEHSPAEGQPIAVMTDYVINYIDGGKPRTNPPSAKPKEPVLLQFNITSEIKDLISLSSKNLDALANNLELDCFQFDNYGKNFIKTQKLSPDSYLQMAMQFAFYRLHKTPAAHYESAATRMYVGGRTETIRSCSIESVAFAKAMLSSQTSDKDKISALKAAIKGHKDYTVQALQGLGVDRHLLGLKKAALENGEPLHKLYSDVGFTRSTHMRLSTSQVACKADGFMCYGPLVPNGYATCYNPRNKDINFALSAFVADPDTLCANYRQALEQSLMDMHDLLSKNVAAKL